jgi:hypothetical protein
VILLGILKIFIAALFSDGNLLINEMADSRMNPREKGVQKKAQARYGVLLKQKKNHIKIMLLRKRKAQISIFSTCHKLSISRKRHLMRQDNNLNYPKQ